MPDALTMTKVAGATLDVRFDWSALLGNDTIAGVAWAVSGVTAGTTSNTTTTATQRISGGSAGTTATVECTITTAASYVYVRTVAIDVVASIDACEIIKASGETISVPAPTWSDLNGDTIASYSWAAAASSAYFFRSSSMISTFEAPRIFSIVSCTFLRSSTLRIADFTWS